MSTSAVEDRRKYLRAFGYNRACEVRRTGEAFSASLVDISRGGMRLLLSQGYVDAPSLRAGEVLKVDVLDLARPDGLRGLECEVRWQQGAQFGVRFSSPLRHGTAELQELISFETDRGLFLKPVKS